MGRGEGKIASFASSHVTPRASIESNLLSLSPRLINSNWVRVWPGLSAGLPGSPKMRLPRRVLYLPGKKYARATFTLVILAPYLLISAVSDDLLPPLRRPRFRLKLDFYFRGYLRNLSTDFGMDFEL